MHVVHLPVCFNNLGSFIYECKKQPSLIWVLIVSGWNNQILLSFPERALLCRRDCFQSLPAPCNSTGTGSNYRLTADHMSRSSECCEGAWSDFGIAVTPSLHFDFFGFFFNCFSLQLFSPSLKMWNCLWCKLVEGQLMSRCQALCVSRVIYFWDEFCE